MPLLKVPDYAAGVDSWFLIRANWVERILLIAGGLFMVYSSWVYDALGLGLIVLVIILQKTRTGLSPA